MKKGNQSNNNKTNIIPFKGGSGEDAEQHNSSDKDIRIVAGNILYDVYKWFLSIPILLRIILLGIVALVIIVVVWSLGDNSQQQVNNYIEATQSKEIQDSTQTDVEESDDGFTVDRQDETEVDDEVSRDVQELVEDNDDALSNATTPELDDEIETDTDELEQDMVSLSWRVSDIELCKKSVLNSIDDTELIAECQKGFQSAILNRQEDVNLDQRMTADYVDSIRDANDIYKEYNEFLEYEDKVYISEGAANKRDNAKNIYRQVSNEQIIANYYARIALDAKGDDTTENQIGYYLDALNYYFDAYAVSCKNNNEKYKALNYAATCYFNIGACSALDIDMRKEAYLYAIAVFNLYLDKGADNEVLVTQFSIGRAYMRLCELEGKCDDKNECRQFYYACEAYNSYMDMLDNPNCRTKTRPNVYQELTYLTQYISDHIDSSIYEEYFSRRDLVKAHSNYENEADYKLNVPF